MSPLQWARSAPGFVIFTLEEAYPVLAPPREKGLQRLLRQKQISLRELSQRFERVARDRKVKGVVLHLRPTPIPLSHVEFLREQVERLKQAGKKTVAWSHSFSTSNYYLAAACDEVLCQETGGIGPLGVRRGFVFLKDALARIGLQGDFIQITPYKSAPDPLMRSEMSEEAREMMSWLADSQFEDFVEAVAEGRGISEDHARKLIDDSPYVDAGAREAGLVDALVGEEDLPVISLRTASPSRSRPGTRPREDCVRSRCIRRRSTWRCLGSRAISSTGVARGPHSRALPSPSCSANAQETSRWWSRSGKFFRTSAPRPRCSSWNPEGDRQPHRRRCPRRSTSSMRRSALLRRWGGWPDREATGWPPRPAT